MGDEQVIYLLNTKVAIKTFINNFLDHKLQGLEAVQKFKVKLVLTEMLSNAYIHGNQSQQERHLLVKYDLKPSYLFVSVEDEGVGYGGQSIQDGEVTAMSENGRGLEIIQALSESIQVQEDGRQISVKINLEKLLQTEV